jgi:hypothetical protein
MTAAQVVLLGVLFDLGRTPGEGFCLAVAGMTTIGASAGATAHTLAGTPHVLTTILPSLVLGFLFNVLYARSLHAAAAPAAG